MSIELKLKRLLALKEMTQKELSEISGVRLPTISDICTGKTRMLSIKTIDAICTALNCKPSAWIIYTSTSNEP